MLKIINNFKIVARPLLIQTRNYPGRTPAMKHDIYDHIQWVRPAKIPSTEPVKSGDCAPLKYPEKDDLIYEGNKEELLKDVSELTKRVLSMELNPRRQTVTRAVAEMVDKVKRHDRDIGSMECIIAAMTAKIRAGQDALELNPKNMRGKQKLKELIERRKKFLRLLRKYDYRRFEWVLEQLDLKYVPYPVKFHLIARKDSMRKLTKQYCDKIKQNRLDSLKDELASQQLDFLDNKIKKLEFIRNEQIECKVPVTISKDKIDAVKKQYADLKQKQEEFAEVRRLSQVRDDYEIKL